MRDRQLFDALLHTKDPQVSIQKFCSHGLVPTRESATVPRTRRRDEGFIQLESQHGFLHFDNERFQHLCDRVRILTRAQKGSFSLLHLFTNSLNSRRVSTHSKNPLLFHCYDHVKSKNSAPVVTQAHPPVLEGAEAAP
jgi:hypothetical protein